MRQPSIHGEYCSGQITPVEEGLAGQDLGLACATCGLCQRLSRVVMDETEQQGARAMCRRRPHPCAIERLDLPLRAGYCRGIANSHWHGWCRPYHPCQVLFKSIHIYTS